MSEPLFEWALSRVECELCGLGFEAGVMALEDLTSDGLRKVWLCESCYREVRAIAMRKKRGELTYE